MYASPARRIIEVARRFDAAPLCNGAPCQNVLVVSACDEDLGADLDRIADMTGRRLRVP